METLNNLKPIEKMVGSFLTIKDKIDETTKEMNNYFEWLKEEKKNEKEEDEIKGDETICDRLGEMVERRKVVLENGKETNELIENMKMKIEKMMGNCENDKAFLEKANDELIEKVLELEERKRIREIKPFQDKIDEINKKSNKRKQELEKDLKNPDKYIIKKNEEERKQEEDILMRTNNTIALNEMKQIEEWTSMKIEKIIFDSDVDNWKYRHSVFDRMVMNKSNLIFIIEDEDGNKFGSYINAKIDNYGCKNDPNAFVFSLKSNGGLNGMMKFDTNQSKYAFLLYGSYDGYLFDIGRDIRIYKEYHKSCSYCSQNSLFEYNGIPNALCGKSGRFTPKRITVIQLI